MPVKTKRLDEIYKPYLYQERFHASIAKKRILKWGRRCGKTEACGIETIAFYHDFISVPKPEILVPRLSIGVIGPTESDLRDPWRTLLSRIPSDLFVRPPSEDKWEMNLLRDCRILFKSAYDPELVRAMGFDLVWITEAFSLPDVVWESRIEPMLLSPGRAGYAIIEGVPTTEYNWAEDLFDRGQADHEDFDAKEIESFFATTEDNPDIDKAELAKIKSRITEDAYLREYGAQAQSGEGRAFRNVRNCIGGEYGEPETGREYVLGVDLGKARDFTVIVVADRERRRVVDFDRFSKLDWTIQKSRIQERAERWNHARVVLDSTGLGDPIYDDLRLSGNTVKGVSLSGQEKHRLMVQLALALEKETVKFPDERTMVRELENCQRKALPHQTRFDHWEAPTGQHDDCVIALALMVDGCYSTNSGMMADLPKLPRYIPLEELED